MIVIASHNGRVGMKPAVDVLRAGGSALDAVEAGIRQVELVASDHSVGLGGYPNILGEVEVDAGIMDGQTRGVGAVAAIRDFAHPISIARQVMMRLPHVLLVGTGAERFAAEIGAERLKLLTPESEAAWRDRITRWTGVDPDQVAEQPNLIEIVRRAIDEHYKGGTVNFLALDGTGSLAAGVSTSGFAWKYPGRVGDSPVAGCGYYADNRYGAAACTGFGELTIRAGTARSLVQYLQLGYEPEQAGQAAVRDLATLTCEKWVVNILVLDPQGRAFGFSNNTERRFLAITPEMDEPEDRPYLIVH